MLSLQTLETRVIERLLLTKTISKSEIGKVRHLLNVPCFVDFQGDLYTAHWPLCLLFALRKKIQIRKLHILMELNLTYCN